MPGPPDRQPLQYSSCSCSGAATYGYTITHSGTARPIPGTEREFALRLKRTSAGSARTAGAHHARGPSSRVAAPGAGGLSTGAPRAETAAVPAHACTTRPPHRVSCLGSAKRGRRRCKTLARPAECLRGGPRHAAHLHPPRPAAPGADPLLRLRAAGRQVAREPAAARAAGRAAAAGRGHARGAAVAHAPEARERRAQDGVRARADRARDGRQRVRKVQRRQHLRRGAPARALAARAARRSQRYARRGAASARPCIGRVIMPFQRS